MDHGVVAIAALLRLGLTCSSSQGGAGRTFQFFDAFQEEASSARIKTCLVSYEQSKKRAELVFQ